MTNNDIEFEQFAQAMDRLYRADREKWKDNPPAGMFFSEMIEELKQGKAVKRMKRWWHLITLSCANDTYCFTLEDLDARDWIVVEDDSEEMRIRRARNPKA